MTFTLQHKQPAEQPKKPPVKRSPSGATVYTVTIKASGEHSYFGSLSAIYDDHNEKDLHVKLDSLYNYGITEKHPYDNKYCSIKKGQIKRKKGGRRKP
jgi:hypothetical protein